MTVDHADHAAKSPGGQSPRSLRHKLPDGWATVGAWLGGTVSSLALLNSGPDRFPFVLAATAAGVFRSVDEGHTWTRSNSGLDDPALAVVAAAPGPASQADIAFASTENGRLFHSGDGGETWSELESWAGLGTANAIVPSPNFAEDQSLFIATSGGVMRSTDGARSWESSTFGLLDVEVLCLACAPEFSRHGLIWAGTARGGLYRSRNAALAWRESGLGLPDAPIQCIAVSPHFVSDSTLWVGLEGQGIYQSVDAGEHWVQIARELEQASVNALVVVADGNANPTDAYRDAHHMVAATDQGLYFSTDSGMHWSPATSGAFAALDLIALPNGQVLGATYIDGVIRSAGSLAEWTVANSGLSAHAPPLVAVTVTHHMLALDRDGAAALSRDGGGTWADASVDDGFDQLSALATGQSGESFFLAGKNQIIRLSPQDGALHTYPAPFDLESQPHVMAVAPVPGQEQPILAVGPASGPIYLVSDFSGAWTEIPSPAPSETLYHLDLWTTEWRGGVELTALTGWPDPRGYYQFNVWSCDPEQADWQPLASLASDIPSVFLCVTATQSGDIRFLATRNRLVTLRQGAEGREAKDGEVQVAQHFFDADTRITALACSPTFLTDQTVCVASNRGLHRSTDAGNTWQQIPVPAQIASIVSLQWQSDQLLTVTAIGGEVLRVQLPA